MMRSESFVVPTRDVRAKSFRSTVKSGLFTLSECTVRRDPEPPSPSDSTLPTLSSLPSNLTRTVKLSLSVKVQRRSRRMPSLEMLDLVFLFGTTGLEWNKRCSFLCYLSFLSMPWFPLVRRVPVFRRDWHNELSKCSNQLFDREVTMPAAIVSPPLLNKTRPMLLFTANVSRGISARRTAPTFGGRR